MKELIEKANSIRQELKDALIADFDNFELYNVDTHYVEYRVKIGDEIYHAKIWTANGEDCAKFYDNFGGIQIEYAEYTDEDRKKLWAKAQDDKAQTGEKRNISKTQMRNDLYFSFQGVFGQVKFSGYDDNDWWTKYKPSEVKESDEVIWQIDLEKMIATYKPRN